MAESAPFRETLRSEYDPAVLDRVQRAQRARRVHAALCAAGLWRTEPCLLDVGCGSGLLLAALGDDVRQRVGCDLRREIYMQARSQVDGVLFVQADGMRLPFPEGRFDVVLCLAVMGEFSDWRAALSEMARCVAPGGVLYVTVTNSRFLLRLFRLAECLGYKVARSQWAYAQASMRLAAWEPQLGFGVPSLAGWHYVHLTPYLICSQWPWLRAVPLPLLDWLARRLAPSFGYAWRRTSGQERGATCGTTLPKENQVYEHPDTHHSPGRSARPI